jgi:hypothetical protein
MLPLEDGTVSGWTRAGAVREEERAAVDMSVIRLVKRAHILTLHGEGTTFFPPRTISQGLMRAIVSFIEERQEGIDEQTAASPPQPQSLL